MVRFKFTCVYQEALISTFDTSILISILKIYDLHKQIRLSFVEVNSILLRIPPTQSEHLQIYSHIFSLKKCKFKPSSERKTALLWIHYNSYLLLILKDILFRPKKYDTFSVGMLLSFLSSKGDKEWDKGPYKNEYKKSLRRIKRRSKSWEKDSSLNCRIIWSNFRTIFKL